MTVHTLMTPVLDVKVMQNNIMLLLFIISHLAPCGNGDLRLVGGNVDQEGRVEICIGNIWGTVCDDFWGNTDAQVVCGKLGYLKTGMSNAIFSLQVIFLLLQMQLHFLMPSLVLV